MPNKRGRPPLSASAQILRAAFANALREKVGAARGSQSRAAEKLGISRQAISLYVNGKATPSADLLQRACAEFELAFNAGESRIDSGSFAKQLKPHPVALQLPLFQALQQVSGPTIDRTCAEEGRTVA